MRLARLGRGVTPVALLAEGVDRNENADVEQGEIDASPSSRRAWIEMRLARLGRGVTPVALLAEGVDRNQTV